MKNTLITILFFAISLQIFSQSSSNYILVVNGDSIHIDLNKNYKYDYKGKTLPIKLIQPLTLSYNDDKISFKYPNDLSVSKVSIDSGIDQIMAMTATGSGYMVQTYSQFDPSSLITIMVNEITKESVSYGYTKELEDIEYKIKSGHTLKGVKATLKYKGETEVYTVLSFGGKDEGIMVITMLLTNELQNEEMIQLFIDSLTINNIEN